MAGLAAVRDIRDVVDGASADDLAQLETDLLAQFVLARAGSGLSDATVQNDLRHLGMLRDWLDRPLWTMTPADADRYFAVALRQMSLATRHCRAATMRAYFRYLELRHKGEVHRLTGYVVECPVDEVNSPRGRLEQKIRIPPTAAEIETMFGGWRTDLARVRRFATAARTFTAARLMAQVGVRINELRMLDLDDVHPSWAGSASCTCATRRGPTAAAPEPASSR